MNTSLSILNEALLCISNGHKPKNHHRWGPGVRDIYALHCIISGKGFLKTLGETFLLKSGDSFLVFPNVEVSYYPDENDPWEYIWVDFKGIDAARLVSLTNFKPETPILTTSQENLIPLFRSISSDYLLPYEKERMKANLHLLLSYYIELFPVSNIHQKDDYFTIAQKYIEGNYWKSTLTVAEVVDKVKVERTYLFRLFKEATGMSILNYLTNYRIQMSKSLLNSSDISIKSVAYSVGYPDQLYFSRLFKKITSFTPSEYRKQIVKKIQ